MYKQRNHKSDGVSPVSTTQREQQAAKRKDTTVRTAALFIHMAVHTKPDALPKGVVVVKIGNELWIYNFRSYTFCFIPTSAGSKRGRYTLWRHAGMSYEEASRHPLFKPLFDCEWSLYGGIHQEHHYDVVKWSSRFGQTRANWKTMFNQRVREQSFSGLTTAAVV
jgi:hypothetical protein